jgi:heme exporter protein A
VIDALVVEDLAITRGERRLFSSCAISMQAGEALALVGPNGAGKTSLLRAIAGLIRPLEGHIRFLGPGGAIPAEDARCRDTHLIGHLDGLKTGRTAREELAFQVSWTGGAAAGTARACERLDLNRFLDLEVRKLSAGQRRRLALARLIASPRALWLLDEPLAPLDAAQRSAFGEVMGDHLAAGGLILAAVHDPLPIPTRTLAIGQ